MLSITLTMKGTQKRVGRGVPDDIMDCSSSSSRAASLPKLGLSVTIVLMPVGWS